LKRVLIVDDNVDSAEMMMTMLESVGHKVAIAHDGPEALAVVENFSPEVALLDIGLPVMDGYELGKRLHATTQAASCQLIALTGYGQEHDRAQSKAAGFAAHLVKPVDMKNLLLLIAETP
jgi:CheY-like chemotaxis protein